MWQERPAIEIAADADAEGNPFGVTLIASHGDDVGLLRAAAAIERVLESGRGPRMRPRYPITT